MIQEKQQYPILNCSKISKAKTTSFKLFAEKESSQVPSEIDNENDDLKSKEEKLRNVAINHNFSYLDLSKNQLEKQKSFENIMNETKKILAMKSKIEDESKKREQSKRILKSKKKSQKGKKQTIKVKKQVKIENKKQEEQDIILSELDKQRFSTEMGSIKRLIDKIDWIKNLGEKCNIISPMLFQIEQQSTLNDGQTHKEKELLIHKNEEMLVKLSELEMEIELMKKNLSSKTQERGFLSFFEITQLARLEVKQKMNSNGKNMPDSFSFLQKYLDRENLSLYAEELQIELEHMERIQFHEFDEGKNHQK